MTPQSMTSNATMKSSTDDDKCISAPLYWTLLIVGIILGVVVILWIIRKIVQGPFYRKKNRIDGKVVIVTGCNTGIGKEAALEFAKRGAKVYMACRDPVRCENARLEIVEKSKNENVFNRTLDVASLESVRKFADQFIAEESRLDILVNNAGIMGVPKGQTKDGFELTLGTNHLGHFLLTNLLLDTLKHSAPSRIVVVSSALYALGTINMDDLNSDKSYKRFGAYNQSKLANALFTIKLSEKLHGTGVTVNCLHPGVVKTEITRNIMTSKGKMAKIVQGPFYRKKNRIDGKVVIITGCNTGIGKETALELARRGAKIYMACRDPVRCEGARLEIIEKTKNENIFNRTLDVGSLESVRKFADKFIAEESRLDILINNAGIMGVPKGQTKDGFELTLGTNHLGHFLLTNLLLDTLKHSAPSRIVVVSSALYAFGKINKDDLNSEKSYSKFAAYSQSKLANILFMTKLSEKLHGTDVTVNCVHPGVVKTELGRHMISGRTKALLDPLTGFFFKTPKAGAQTSLRVALDPALEKSTGGYYFDTIRFPLLPKGKNKEMAEWLWTASEEMVGLRRTEQISVVPVTLQVPPSNETNVHTTVIEVEKIPTQSIPDNKNMEECEKGSCEKRDISEKMKQIMVGEQSEKMDEPEKVDRSEKMEKLEKLDEIKKSDDSNKHEESENQMKTDVQEKLEKMMKEVDNSLSEINGHVTIIRDVTEDIADKVETAKQTEIVVETKTPVENMDAIEKAEVIEKVDGAEKNTTETAHTSEKPI